MLIVGAERLDEASGAQAVGRDGSLMDDFVISRENHVVHVRNAPSPAATSAFALARELVDRVVNEGGAHGRN